MAIRGLGTKAKITSARSLHPRNRPSTPPSSELGGVGVVPRLCPDRVTWIEREKKNKEPEVPVREEGLDAR